MVFRLRRDRNIAPTASTQRKLARTVLGVARPFPLLAFKWADSHGHAATLCDEDNGAELGRRIESALKQALDLPVSFKPVDLEPITDLWHLKSCVRYVFRQDLHHGFTHDPFHEASNVGDILGWRLVGQWTARLVKEQLPRLTRADFLDWMGIADPDADVPDWSRLADAAAAAVALPDLDSKLPDAVAARAAAVQLAVQALSIGDVAELLAIGASTARRLRRSPPVPGLQRAVRQQLVLRSVVAVANESPHDVAAHPRR